jgi:hypothetical protein
MWRKENSWPFQDLNSNPSVIQHVVSCYTELHSITKLNGYENNAPLSWFNFLNTVCVCVCVSEREREREREGQACVLYVVPAGKIMYFNCSGFQLIGPLVNWCSCWFEKKGQTGNICTISSLFGIQCWLIWQVAAAWLTCNYYINSESQT